jgi:hypothetical protein
MGSVKYHNISEGLGRNTKYLHNYGAYEQRIETQTSPTGRCNTDFYVYTFEVLPLYLIIPENT